MVILNIKDTIINGYGSYAMSDISVYGWGVIALCFVATIILTLVKGKKGYDEIPEEVEEVKEAE